MAAAIFVTNIELITRRERLSLAKFRPQASDRLGEGQKPHPGIYQSLATSVYSQLEYWCTYVYRYLVLFYNGRVTFFAFHSVSIAQNTMIINYIDKLLLRFLMIITVGKWYKI
jgi:hypothetical protein